MLRVLILAVLLIGGGALVANYAGVVAPNTAPAAADNPVPPAAQPGETQVVVDEAMLSERVSRSVVGQPLAETPLGTAVARRVAVQLRNGQVAIDGDAQVGSSTVPVQSTGTVDPRDGRAVVNVRDVRVAGIPLGEGERRQVQQAIQAEVDQAMARDRLQVSSVTIADGKMTVIGRRG